MYVIVVYDINVERQNDVREFLRRYLKWIQNSVFEGELTPSQLFYIKRKLKTMIDGRDRVIIYVLPQKSCLKERVEIKLEPTPSNTNIL